MPDEISCKRTLSAIADILGEHVPGFRWKVLFGVMSHVGCGARFPSVLGCEGIPNPEFMGGIGQYGGGVLIGPVHVFLFLLVFVAEIERGSAGESISAKEIEIQRFRRSVYAMFKPRVSYNIQVAVHGESSERSELHAEKQPSFIAYSAPFRKSLCVEGIIGDWIISVQEREGKIRRGSVLQGVQCGDRSIFRDCSLTRNDESR